ncbi:hypothetical protein K504DRAFT_397003, partial [Pleomassaria siparia CBS 279.74]
MAPVLLPRILDGGHANLDALGIAYIVLAIVYTLILGGELWLLNRHRSVFSVRIRNIKIVFAAVCMLHVYLVLVLFVYPLNGLFPCWVEFWVMSVFLPSGMAFFQACNARVLTIYESQNRLQRNFLEGARKKRISYTPRGLWAVWRDLNAASKVYVGTVVGLVISFIPAVILFFSSRRFHASYGVFARVVDEIECRRGPEWIPSILVQLFWTSLVGPWILWKIRHVQDIHGWAWQTRLAVLAGLPGTPLWMAFTYGKLPGMRSMDRYFAPAGWFIPSLFVCQQVLILIPLYEVYRAQPRRACVFSSSSSLSSSDTDALTYVSSVNKGPQITLGKELKPKASMQALEYSINNSIESLIDWAASREFTAENTIFLREVRNFRRKWAGLRMVTTAQRRQMFTEASLIFFTLVDPLTAEMPINIEYKVFRSLQNTFSTLEYDPYKPPSRSNTPISPSSRDNVICPWEDTLTRPTSVDSNMTSSSITSSTKSFVPSEFTEDVFDAAFESIKYLVFTNTWPRFVE